MIGMAGVRGTVTQHTDSLSRRVLAHNLYICDKREHNRESTHISCCDPQTIMEDIIKRCIATIDEVSEGAKEIPHMTWKTCAGVAIINVSEVGFFFSRQEGDGLLIKKKKDNTWGAPSALIFTGTAGGFVFGKGEKRIILFPLTELAVKTLCSNTKYQLGADVGLAAGPVGRGAAIAADAGDKGVGATLSYVIEKGALLNVSLTTNFIENRNDVNSAFYGKSATPEEIVIDGAVEIPQGKGVEELHGKLTALSSK
jgi:lipid-binding SYLF domain-containing protein